jgi:hypothetical protein
MGELTERLDKIEELLKSEKQEKEKKLKLPFKARVGKSKAKKGYIGILKLNENRTITPSKQKVEEQTVIVDGVPRLATGDHIYYMGKFPIMILPSCSVEPLTSTSLFEKSLESGSNIKGYSLIMNKMKLDVVGKKTFGGGWIKWIIIIGLIGLVIYAFISQRGGA